jgi:molybdate transport system substrate-binding protein
MRFHRKLLCALWLLLPLPGWPAPDVRVAVASNFLAPMQQLARDFSAQTGIGVQISSGSTGKLYAQIVNGAPFDLFLAASDREPERLEAEGRIQAGTRFTYALGTLVVWSRDAALFHDDNGRAVLSTVDFGHIAIANPRLAPYGAAAQAVFAALGIAQRFQPGLLTGENIAQAYQYVASGNADIGFIALSQLRQPGQPQGGSYWQVTPGLYPPIRQQAVLLAGAQSGPAPRKLWDYLHSESARDTITAYGYTLELARTGVAP